MVGKRIRLIAGAVVFSMLIGLVTGCVTQESETEVTTTHTTAATETTQTSAADTTEVPFYIVEVYEAERRDGQEGTYSIPGIRLNGTPSEEINQKISKYISSFIEDEEWYCGSEFSYAVGDTYVSILVHVMSTIDLDAYDAFNISLTTGALMDDDEFLEANSITKDDYYALVKSTIKLAMDDQPDIFKGSDVFDYVADNLADDRIKLAVPFVSERGNLCFIYNLCLNAGAEEYPMCFDTVTHEHMHNEFGEWSIFGV